LLVSENGMISTGIRLENPYESGYTTGYGLFETILITRGKPLFLKEHYDRMKKSLHIMKLPALPDLELVVKWCEDYICALLQENCIIEFYGKLRINWVKSSSTSAVMHIYGEAFSYPIDWYEHGIKSTFSKDIYYSGSKLDKIKTLSYAENIIEKSNAMEDGYPEIVRVNEAGMICEGVFSNVFWITNNVLYTPALETGALPGIVRHWVLEFAKESGIECIEKAYGRSKINKADAIFFTNSLMGIMPVNEFENRKISTLDDTIYKLISSKYAILLEM